MDLEKVKEEFSKLTDEEKANMLVAIGVKKAKKVKPTEPSQGELFMLTATELNNNATALEGIIRMAYKGCAFQVTAGIKPDGTFFHETKRLRKEYTPRATKEEPVKDGA
jgi:hypothetical protein